MRRLFAIGLLLVSAGCLMPQPKILDDPEVKKAVIDAIRESSKTWTAQNRISNPRIEAGYKMAVYAEIIGVSTELSASGSAPAAPGKP